jgi:hypothetical protein
MFDSITLFHPHQIVGDPNPENEIAADPFPANYRITNFEAPNIRGHYLGTGKKFKLYDPGTGFNAYGDAGYFKYFSASLPRLLHGDNGRLIKNQIELDAALTILRQMAAELGDPQICASHFTRVDLVWQFQVDVETFIRAHRECRHPRINSNSLSS